MAAGQRTGLAALQAYEDADDDVPAAGIGVTTAAVETTSTASSEMVQSPAGPATQQDGDEAGRTELAVVLPSMKADHHAADPASPSGTPAGTPNGAGTDVEDAIIVETTPGDAVSASAFAAASAEAEKGTTAIDDAVVVEQDTPAPAPATADVMPPAADVVALAPPPPATETASTPAPAPSKKAVPRTETPAGSLRPRRNVVPPARMRSPESTTSAPATPAAINAVATSPVVRRGRSGSPATPATPAGLAGSATPAGLAASVPPPPETPVVASGTTPESDRTTSKAPISQQAMPTGSRFEERLPLWTILRCRIDACRKHMTAFRTAEDAAEHVRAVHQQPRNKACTFEECIFYQCAVCFCLQSFPTLALLRRHLVNDHPAVLIDGIFPPGTTADDSPLLRPVPYNAIPKRMSSEEQDWSRFILPILLKDGAEAARTKRRGANEPPPGLVRDPTTAPIQAAGTSSPGGTSAALVPMNTFQVLQAQHLSRLAAATVVTAAASSSSGRAKTAKADSSAKSPAAAAAAEDKRGTQKYALPPPAASPLGQTPEEEAREAKRLRKRDLERQRRKLQREQHEQRNIKRLAASAAAEADLIRRAASPGATVVMVSGPHPAASLASPAKSSKAAKAAAAKAKPAAKTVTVDVSSGTPPPLAFKSGKRRAEDATPATPAPSSVDGAAAATDGGASNTPFVRPYKRVKLRRAEVDELLCSPMSDLMNVNLKVDGA